MAFLFVLALFTILILGTQLNAVHKKSLEHARALEELTKKFASAQEELLKFAPIKDLKAEIDQLANEKTQAWKEYEEASNLLDAYQGKLDIEEMGFFQPKFQFEDILQYKEALDLIRDAQKELVRQKKVVQDLNGRDLAKPGDLAKLALTAFNGEANATVESVTFSNFEKSKEKLTANFNKINGLLVDSKVQISAKLLELKIKELAVAHDFFESERKIKEEQAALKAAMREEESARAEAEELREKAIEEKERYEAAITQARKELESKSAEERAAHEEKIRELQQKLDEANSKKDRATAMAQITKEGHVYIISNVGSFGENVFKIGLTRRTDPMERVRELGDAAVPFHFDVHAIVHAKDAPALEHALHKSFDERRLNKINQRKEFFKVSIEEIAAACEGLGHSAKVTKLAEAIEFKASQKMEKEGVKKAS